MFIEQFSALIFLPFALAVGVWVAWNDMKFMKIPNQSVVVMMVIFIIVGLIALPFWEYLLRYLHFIVVLVIGFVANQVRLMGAGDAKFLAAMAPFFDRADVLPMVQIFAGVLLAAFATHRLFRAIPAMRRNFPDWKSWAHPKFPMGLALSGSLILYLVLGALYGAPSTA